VRKRIQRTLGFVSIHIANLSLENVQLCKGAYVGEASPVYCNDTDNASGSLYDICTVQGADKVKQTTAQKFDDYLRDKLQHLTKNDQNLLSSVLKKYHHLFYGVDNSSLGCTSQVQHTVDTGDAQPIKKKSY